jgi:Fur family ferric uptake transcriptional regulator
MQDQKDLKNAGLKATLPRLKVLSLFENSKERHLSAEDIYKVMLNSGEDVGLATVYRVLTQFEQAGLLIRHHFESGKAVFELNHGNHHDHIVCVKCGRVEEFYDAEIDKRPLPQSLALKCKIIHSPFTEFVKSNLAASKT